MTYDIFSRTAPAMPKTDKSTKFIDFILSKASKHMREAMFSMGMPALSAHLSENEFMYSDTKTSVDSCKSKRKRARNWRNSNDRHLHKRSMKASTLGASPLRGR